MGNNFFFTFLLIKTETLKKISYKLYRTAFRFDFGPQVPKPENKDFHFYAFSCWGTSGGTKLNPKYYMFLNIFFLKRLGLY